MRYLSARSKDIANGPGTRTSIWLTGCTRHCKDCFNQDAWDFNAGKPLTEKAIEKFIALGKASDVAGFSILGGEPLEQNMDELIPFLKRIHEVKPVWMWTGYWFEDLICDQMEAIHYVDVLVDGPFEANNANSKLRFRGSSNQRIIDIRKTFDLNKLTLLDL